LAADLVHRQVTVIAATTTPAAVVAKAATITIPIVFEMGGDPVRAGLVSNLARPGGNITGVTNLNVVLAPKRLELLHELVPNARVMALLIDPTDPTSAETTTRDVQAVAHSFGLELHVLNASSERDFDAVFANLVQLRAGGLVIGASPLFISRAEHHQPQDRQGARYCRPASVVGPRRRANSPHWPLVLRCRRPSKPGSSPQPAG
jgi:putative ABC transport system substrate-binding protein